MKRASLMVTCALCALAGCTFDGWTDRAAGDGARLEGGGPAVWAGEGEPFAYDTPLDLKSATLEGSLGDVRGFSGETWRAMGAYGSGGAFVDLRSRTAEGVAMVRLEVWGDLATLEPGRSYRFGGRFDEALEVTAISCSGPADDEWGFDIPADEVVVDCSEGPEEGTVQLDFTVRLADDPVFFEGDVAAGGGGEVIGSVVYAVPAQTL